MSWRINTRAEAQDSRHFDSGWIDQDSWKPSDGYREPVPFDWLGFILGVLCLGLLAVSLALAIGEVWQWNK